MKNRRRSVLHLFSSLEAGGAEVRTLELIEWLQGQGPEFAQVILQSGSYGSLTSRFEDAGAKVVSQRFRSMKFWLNAWQEVRRAQALHLHVKRGISRPSLLLPLAWCARVPVRIAHFRSDGEHIQVSRSARLVERVSRILIKAFATDIVGVSPAALALGWDQAWERDKRCRVLLSGIRLDRIGDLQPLGNLRRELAAIDGEALVLHVGRDVPLKNRDRAIEVFAALLKVGTEARLVFVGRDDDLLHAAHLRRIEELGMGDRVHFLGQRNDVPQLMADSDVLLMTSSQEGMPGVLLEALAVGTPSVVSDLPGTRFVADRLPGLAVVGLDEADAAWTAALADTIASTNLRQPLRDAVSSSVFDTRVASREFVRLWRGNSSRAH